MRIVVAKIGFVYFSGSGTTEKLVEEGAKVARLEGHQVLVYAIKGTNIVDGRFVDQNVFQALHTCHAIVFASPTYMGGPSAQFKAFADASSDFWEAQKWAGKIAAGITCGSAPNGDQSSTIHYFQTLAMQHGMLWMGLGAPHNNQDSAVNRLGHQGGVVAHCIDEKVTQLDLNSSTSLAQRISQLV